MATLARSNFSCLNICHCLIVLQNYEWRKELISRTLQWCSAVPLVGCLSTNDKDGGGRKAVLSHVASLFLSTSTTRHFGPSDDSPQIYAFSAALLTTTNITCSRNRVMTDETTALQDQNILIFREEQDQKKWFRSNAYDQDHVSDLVIHSSRSP